MTTDVTKKRIRMQKIALIYVDLPDCDKQADLAEIEGLCATAEAKIVLEKTADVLDEFSCVQKIT